MAEIAAEHAFRPERQVGRRQPAGQPVRQVRPGQAVHPCPQLPAHAHAHMGGRDPVVQHPGAGLRELERFGQQPAHVEHLDPLAAHRLREGVMVGLRPLDPEHVVEEQRLAVLRRQAAMGEAGAADHHLPQPSGLGMDAECRFGHGIAPHSRAATLSATDMSTVRISSSGQTKTSHRSYGTRPMARPPITTAKVGLIKFTKPFAD